MGPRLARQLLAGALLVGLVVAAALLPVPYVALSPGPVYDTLGAVDGQPLITVTGTTTYPTEGRLDLTTVSEAGGPGRAISLVEALAGWVRPAVAVLPEELLYPPDTDAEDVQEQSAADMRASQDAASVAALRLAGVPLTTTVVISAVEDDGPSAGVLEVDDVVVAVDGVEVSTPEQLRRELAAVEPGDPVTLRVERDDAVEDLEVTTGTTTEGGRRAYLGVGLEVGYDSDVTVDIQLDDVGGPSAGLMFALGIYDVLTPGALTGGRHVAGTGTMAVDGTVGPIGGIQQKMRGAVGAGATVFLVPPDNCPDAVASAPGGLRLVRADTLRSAARSLDELDRRGDAATLPTC